MKINIYTDGACRGNQFRENFGAWAYLIDYNNKAYMTGQSSIIQNTTNNIMELTAVIKALEYLTNITDPKTKITVYSDSTYIVMGINVWYKGWIKKNWKDVKNVELWKRLLELQNNFYNITFQHIPGHSGNTGNEYVDKLCNEVMDGFKPKEQT